MLDTAPTTQNPTYKETSQAIANSETTNKKIETKLDIDGTKTNQENVEKHTATKYPLNATSDTIEWTGMISDKTNGQIISIPLKESFITSVPVQKAIFSVDVLYSENVKYSPVIVSLPNSASHHVTIRVIPDKSGRQVKIVVRVSL